VSRRDDERVADILDAASEIAEIIELGRDAWDKDRIRRLAVERLLEIIGAAANSLSEDFRMQHPGVPLARHHRPAGRARAPLPSSRPEPGVGDRRHRGSPARPGHPPRRMTDRLPQLIPHIGDDGGNTSERLGVALPFIPMRLRMDTAR
jgi:hypothetical protein